MGCCVEADLLGMSREGTPFGGTERVSRNGGASVGALGSHRDEVDSQMESVVARNICVMSSDMMTGGHRDMLISHRDMAPRNDDWRPP